MPSLEPSAIKLLLTSHQIEQVREGLLALRDWTTAQDEPNLEPFGYRGATETPETNPLFDDLLTRHCDVLTVEDRFVLVEALFRGDAEDFELAALVTALRQLLDGADEVRERRWAQAVRKGLTGYEYGHRACEESFLDVLLGELVLKLGPAAAADLLEWAPDELISPPDDLGALFVAALSRKPAPEVERRLAKRASSFFIASGAELDNDAELTKRFAAIRALLTPQSRQLLDGARAYRLGVADVQRLLKSGTTDIGDLRTAMQALGGLEAADLKDLREPIYRALRIQGTKLDFETVQAALERLLARHPDPEQSVVVHLVRYALGFHHKKMVAFVVRLALTASNGAQIVAVLKRARVWNPLAHPMAVHADGTVVQAGKNPFAAQDFNDSVKATIDKNLDAALARLGP